MGQSDKLLTTAVIGLGAMGSGIARNLHTHGILAAAWNRTSGNAAHLAQDPTFPLLDSLDDAVNRAELIITSLSVDTALLEIVERIAPLLTPNQIVLDTSTVSPKTAREVAMQLSRVGCGFIDGPVTGGMEGARQGTLTMMAGGNAGLLDTLRPTLQCFTSAVHYLGPVGAGQAAKAVNQLIAAGINQAVTEGLALAQTQGLELSQVIEVLRGGVARNWFLDNRNEAMLTGRFTPGFKISLHHKDLRICRDIAQQQGVASPLLELMLADYAQLIEAGRGELDTSALFRLKQERYRNG